MKKYAAFILACSIHGFLFSQDSITKLQIAVRGEGYFNVSTGGKQEIARTFLVSHNSNNIPSINLLMSTVSFQSKQWQGELSGLIGTYAEQNLAHEIGLFRNIGSLWVANKPMSQIEILVGVYPSHIGLESPVSMDCMNPSRSIVADNTPYYQSGIRVRHEMGDDAIALHFLNGWQRSSIDSMGIIPAMGYEYTTKRNEVNVRVSGFVGSATHQENEGIRYYQHIGLTYQPRVDLSIAGSIDLGYQLKNDMRTFVIAPVIMGQWKMNESLIINGRVEYYHDPHGMIIGNASGLSAIGYSMGIDWKAMSDILLRCEYRSVKEMRDVMNTRNDYPVLGLHLQWFIAKDLM